MVGGGFVGGLVRQGEPSATRDGGRGGWQWRWVMRRESSTKKGMSVRKMTGCAFP